MSYSIFKLLKFFIVIINVLILNFLICISEDIIPNDRRIDWSSAGVPGGIPNRTIIFTTIDSALYGNGDIDASNAINNAIYFCPEGQAIYIPSGKYRLNNLVNLKFKSNITIRGAGADKTILLPSGRAFMFGDDFQSPLDISIISGADKGSNQLILSDASSLMIGELLKIDRDNDTNLVVSIDGYKRLISQMIMITSIEGNKVNFSPALTWNYTDNPKLTSFMGINHVIKFSGIEDMTIDHTQGDKGESFFFDQCYGCWVKNITSIKPGEYHSVELNSLNCEIRDSYFTDSKTYGPNNGGITLYGTNTAYKIENNIFYKCFPAIELSNSSSGNYIGYNFGTYVEGGIEWSMSSGEFDDNHGPHNMMNLWEGNVGEMFQSDGYFGSGSHGTLFRNNFTGTHSVYQGNYKAISLNRWSYYYNIIGNVLGVPGFKPDFYEVEINGYPYQKSTIYQLGYPNMGNNFYSGINPPDTNIQALDLKVKQTLLRHGNYDFYNNNVIWDSSISEHHLPASYYYKTKPSWWMEEIPWPPIGPDVEGLTNLIPAQLRFGKISTSIDINESEINNKDKIYPNPSFESVNFSYTVYKETIVNISLYNEFGMIIKTLINEYQLPGEYSINFNTLDLFDCVYFIRIETGNKYKTYKFILEKH